jgi:hypothetical protein
MKAGLLIFVGSFLIWLALGMLIAPCAGRWLKRQAP